MPEATSMTRAEILEAAAKAVTQDRAATHGSVERNFELIAKLWSIWLEAEISPTDVAVMMMMLKQARIKSTPGHHDHWSDVAGYAACGGEIATKPG